MPSHEPDELRRMHETIDTYYPKTYLSCWAAVGKPVYKCLSFYSVPRYRWPLVRTPK